jgi:exopolysaccharide biosynthesis protein
MNHKYLATFFYSDDTINECLNRNSITSFYEYTDLDQIEIVDYSTINDIQYKDEYEKEILENIGASDYKIIEISEEKYTGYLAVIYDPSRVEVAVTKYLGESGQYLTTISEENESVLAINGGGFRNGESGPRRRTFRNYI